MIYKVITTLCAVGAAVGIGVGAWLVIMGFAIGFLPIFAGIVSAVCAWNTFWNEQDSKAWREHLEMVERMHNPAYRKRSRW
ncbi:gp083 [Rhodococcus phage ReqiDocB7]|uniref:gp083 n=1 Tax=Rhodococcus phage ReqiDocB7 TaxID=691966 RepID=UPI0001CDD86C|nr:gp083 [Rhodococcus phage ReqiDocB7]ADD80869.1 gp083 [Rhodococcus phage ReqiDocB7]